MVKNKFDPKEPVKFRDAPEKVRVLATDLKSDRPIIIATMKPDGTEWWGRRYPDGRLEHDRDSDYDLVNVPREHEVWINLYDSKDGIGRFYGFAYSSRETADEIFGANRTACVRVKFTEGEGL
jgi:hypothetical protein